MSEYFVVRLSRNENEAMPWAVWSSDQKTVIVSGELESTEQIKEAVPYTKNRTVIALLASSEVLIREIAIPKVNIRQLQNMIPYLLEEELAQDVDDIHFCVLEKNKTTATVACVESAYLSQAMDRWKQQGVIFKQVLPDALALPVSSTGLTTVKLGDQWLFRSSEYHGAAVEGNWLALFMDAGGLTTRPVSPAIAELPENEETADAEDEQTEEVLSTDSTDDTEQPQSHDMSELVIHCYSNFPENQQALAGKWKAIAPELPIALLAKGAVASRINLLSGEFKQDASLIKQWRFLFPAGIAFSIYIAITFMQQWSTIYQNNQLAEHYHTQSERIFRSIFPEKRKIPTVSYMKRLVGSKVRVLGGEQDSSGVIEWLMRLQPVFSSVEGVELQDFQFDSKRSEVKFKIRAKSFNSFETLRTKLSAAYQVEQGQLDKDGDYVYGSDTLRKK